MSRFILEQAPAAQDRFILEDAPPKPAGKNFDLKGEGYERIDSYSGRDAVGGAIRGLGSLGSTVLRPFESEEENQQRRQKIDRGMAEFLGANPESTAYKTNKLVAEVAGTAGGGGLIAKGLSLIPGAAAALPTLLPAIESGGMLANGAKGLYGLLNRVAGGAVSGAATAGLVDPKDAQSGAMTGGAFPLGVKVAGEVGGALGRTFGAKPINPVLQQTARESVDAGYVIPPNMVAPSFRSQVLESVAGKQATQQIASTKNTEVTEKLTRQALGIADDVPLTKSTLEGLRKTAGKAYAEVSSLSPQAAADLEALKVARNESQGWFAAYNRLARPDDLAQAKQFRAQAEALETALEQHAKAASRPDLIPSLRDARKEIAKTYTVQRALNDASGTVDARVFGRMYEKGLPLSDGLDVAGKFASAFPSVAKSTQQVGSPAAHNLKSIASMAMAGGGYMSMGPLGVAAAAVPFVAPPVARSVMFSKPAQRAVAGRAGQPGLLSQGVDEMLPLMYRINPVLLSPDR